MRRSDGVGTGNVSGDGRRDGLSGAVAAVPGLSPHAWRMWGCCQHATPRVTLETPREGQAAPPILPGLVLASRVSDPPRNGCKLQRAGEKQRPRSVGKPEDGAAAHPGGAATRGPGRRHPPRVPTGTRPHPLRTKGARRPRGATGRCSDGARLTAERDAANPRAAAPPRPPFPPSHAHPPTHTPHPPGGPRPASPPLTWVPGGGSSRSRRRRR